MNYPLVGLANLFTSPLPPPLRIVCAHPSLQTVGVLLRRGGAAAASLVLDLGLDEQVRLRFTSESPGRSVRLHCDSASRIQ